MESLHSLLRMHWDHEPNPNPSQEGNRNTRANARSPPGRGAGVGRFMERLRDTADVRRASTARPSAQRCHKRAIHAVNEGK